MSRAPAEPPARKDRKGKVPLVPRAGSPPGSGTGAETKQAVTSGPAGRCSAPTGGTAAPEDGDRSSRGAGAWRPPALQRPSEDDAQGGEQRQGHPAQRCSRAMSRDGWHGTLARGDGLECLTAAGAAFLSMHHLLVHLPSPSTTGQAAASELGGNGWSSSGAGGLEQRLYPQEEHGNGHTTVPSLGERLATAGMIHHVPSSLL